MDRRLYLVSLFMLIALLLLPIVTAQSIVYRIIPVVDEVSPFEEAVYNITLLNVHPQRQTVYIYSPNIDAWNVRARPDIFTLEPDESASSLVSITPKEDVLPSNEYGVQLNARVDGTGELLKGFAFVFIKSQEQVNREYLPIITMNVSDVGEIDPREGKTLSVTLENKNVRDIKDLEIIVSSELLYKETYVDLAPLEKKIIQFPLLFDESTAPLEDNFIVRMRFANQTLESASSDYKIADISEVSQDVSQTKNFLYYTETVIFTNTGNVKSKVSYPFSRNIFMIPTLQATFEKDDVTGSTIIYSQTLAPNESSVLVIEYSYRPYFYLFLIALVVFVLYFLFRSPVVIRKSVSSITTANDEELSELKILIHIKNRTSRIIDNVVVKDRIPRITKVGKDFALGTLKPTKILNHEKKGTILNWEIHSLDSYEERVIAYKVFTNLKILGGINLPLALVKFKGARGKSERVVSSNKVHVVIKRFSKKE